MHECLQSLVTDKSDGNWANHCFRFREGKATCSDKPREFAFFIRTGYAQGSQTNPDSPLGQTLMGVKTGDTLDGLVNGCRVTNVSAPINGRVGIGSGVHFTCPAKIHLRFCIDRYEHPNVEGKMPDRQVSWWKARDACQAEGKRLCYEHEWTLACEGPEMKPYPYGWRRDNHACNTSRCIARCGGEKFLGPNGRDTICRQFDDVNNEIVERPMCPVPSQDILDGHNQPSPEIVNAEIDRVEHATGQDGVTFTQPSGTPAACVSDYGVHDMPGNIDEWTACFDNCSEYQSNCKGGHYLANVRNRCRPVTVGHDEAFMMPTMGFRCCTEAK
jgi:hypothetical protein